MVRTRSPAGLMVVLVLAVCSSGAVAGVLPQATNFETHQTNQGQGFLREPTSGDSFTASVMITAPATTAPEPRPISPTQAPCGQPGLQPCPLQAWMRKNIASPLASSNTPALAAGLDRLANLTPNPAWRSWPTIASQGASAARRGDLVGARASCKACHEAWREQYKAKFRALPIPP